jgi:hypothetical protein
MNSDSPDKLFLAVKLGDRSNLIIGELLSENATEIVLHYPILINMYSDDEGHLNVATSKYFMFAENDKVALLKTTIASVAKPRQELVQYYLNFVERYAEKINAEMEIEVLGIGSSAAPVEEFDAFGSDVTVPKVVH